MASSALLAEIQKGKGLKKAVTNDRSGPLVDSGKSASRGPALGAVSAPSLPSSATSGHASASAGPPQLGGLFAGGMPKLKPAGGGASPARGPPLAKPPSIPKRESAAPSAPPPPVRPPPAISPAVVPRPPARPPPSSSVPIAAPTIPARAPQPPSAPPRPPPATPPPVTRAPPPPVRSVPLPSPTPPTATRGPPPAIPNRSSAPVSRESPARSNLVPAIPPRRPPPPNVHSTDVDPQAPQASPTLTRRAPPIPNGSGPGRAAPPPPPVTTGRAPPTLPTRPVSTPPVRQFTAAASETPSRAVPPPPPSRNVPENLSPAIPRVRAVSASESSNTTSAPAPPPPRPPAAFATHQRSASLASPQMQSSRGFEAEKHIPKNPSPPATSGGLTFPLEGFPPPRPFSMKARGYSSGSAKGSTFNLRSL